MSGTIHATSSPRAHTIYNNDVSDNKLLIIKVLQNDQKPQLYTIQYCLHILTQLKLLTGQTQREQLLTHLPEDGTHRYPTGF